MKTAIKLMSCEKHVRRVWHPVGQPCPACHPELYGPIVEEPQVVYLVDDEVDDDD